MPGPRDYSSGTEKALFLLSQGTCYYPACASPVIEFVDGIPVVNVHISHVRGAKPGSARYDPNMSDDQRASFSNVVLLCKPHHDLVDRIKPDEFPPETLLRWKADRETAGVAALAGLRGLTEERLTLLIESAVSAAGPVREVVLELDGGVLLPTHGVAKMPLEGWRDILDLNQETLTGKRLLLVTTARNTGRLRAAVESVSIFVSVASNDSRHPMSLLGQNDFPGLNPQLSHPLEVGSSFNWLTSLASVEMIVQASALGSLQAREFWATADLGSGETVESARYPLALLPL